MKVYLLMRHPPYPYQAGCHLKAGELVGVYSEPIEPRRIAQQKNTGRSYYLWRVHAKQVKGGAA